MAGFNKIKRTLICMTTDQLLWQDKEPVVIEYQKFYSDEEMLGFSHEQLGDLLLAFGVNTPGRYMLTVDTLGVYINSKVRYDISFGVSCKTVWSNLDDVNLPETILVKEQPLEETVKTFLEDPEKFELGVPFIALDFYVNLLKDLGFEKTDYETNGWSCDFWMYFKKDNISICLIGDLWYAKEFTLFKDIDEE